MRFQLDFDSQTVTIEAEVDMGKFVNAIKKLIPNWKDWKLTTKVVMHNHNWPVWYINPWYTDFRYYTGITPSINYSVGKDEIYSSSPSTPNDSLYIDNETNTCHFNVTHMSGVHEVLIN
jgi:hypothetical protein